MKDGFVPKVYSDESTEKTVQSKYDNCMIWFDGCNNCKVLADQTLQCGTMQCDEQKEAYCKYEKRDTKKQDECYNTLSKRIFNQTQFENWEGQVDYLFLNEKPEKCPIQNCSLTDCSPEKVVIESEMISLNEVQILEIN